jgi:alpha-amylase/alpha-mannosidase (GH57 family)/ABC-type transporter Mla MlaB component
MRPFVLHAHFYQPERSNPWTAALDPEPSAAPDRDWNERILRECYRPNGTARIFDEYRRVERIVNNYERVSFNFGPTLLSWMEQAHPETYAKVIDGDWRSAVRLGHGNALAQAYNHMILPLANERDRRTQIVWGLADFRRRFGRDAEGLWLPEAAVDPATVDALIDAGVAFTILAPHQAARVRPDGSAWRDAHDALDTSRAYRHRHSDGSGRSIAVFFYDGALAQALAFDPATVDAGVLLERIQQADHGDGLVHAAVDGETFGHHHAFGELGLAYALFEAADARGLTPTNYATWLAEHPPTDEVEVVGGEGTSWSCAHGVGRWYHDCGCSTDALPGWNQAWRTPLRAALDAIRDAAIDAFERQAARLLKDPWAARDDYVHVRLGSWTAAEFLERHALRNLDDAQKIALWTLLESQRYAMVMYTSCGWFFADVSGIETVYVLRFAARALGLLEELGGAKGVRDRVLALLANAESNRPGIGTAADVWRSDVEPAVVTPTRIAAHLALLGLVRPLPDALDVAAHDVVLRDRRSETRGRLGLTTAHATVTSLTTRRIDELAVAAVHLGGLDFHGVVTPYPGDAAFAASTDALWSAFPTAPVAQLIRLVGEVPDGEEFGLEVMLPEGRQELVGAIFSDLAARFHESYSRLYADHRRILEMLTAAGYELPRDMRAAAELTLATQLEQQLAAVVEPTLTHHQAADPSAFAAVCDLVRLARTQGYQLDLAPLEDTLTAVVTAAVRTAAVTLDNAEVASVERWLALCGEVGVDIDLSRAQEHAYEVAARARAGRLGPGEADCVARLGRVLGLSAVAWSSTAEVDASPQLDA